MSQNFKILFFLKKGKRSNEKSLPIYVRVTINRERVEWTCQRNCDPSKWNQQTGRVIGNKNETKSLIQYLDALQANIFELQREYTLRNEPVTSAQVRTKILHETDAQSPSGKKFFISTGNNILSERK